jgi:hypothetical protein
MRGDADAHELGLLHPRALLLELARGFGGIQREHLEVDDRPQPQLRCGGRRRPGEAVVGGRRNPGAQRFEDAEAGDRGHFARLETVLPVDVRGDPRPERLPVAEAGVHRVLEVRVRIDEARDDRRIRVVPFCAASGDLDDRAVLVTDEAAFDRRPVDGQHPVG